METEGLVVLLLLLGVGEMAAAMVVEVGKAAARFTASTSISSQRSGNRSSTSRSIETV